MEDANFDPLRLLKRFEKMNTGCDASWERRRHDLLLCRGWKSFV